MLYRAIPDETVTKRTDEGFPCTTSFNGHRQRQVKVPAEAFKGLSQTPAEVYIDNTRYGDRQAEEGTLQYVFTCVVDAPSDNTDVGSGLSEEDDEFYDQEYSDEDLEEDED